MATALDTLYRGPSPSRPIVHDREHDTRVPGQSATIPIVCDQVLSGLFCSVQVVEGRGPRDVSLRVVRVKLR